MISKLRKFSNSIFAKVFLFIVVLPFVFWGMGDLFSGGNQNTIAKIGKDKISAQEFIEFVKNNASKDNEINKNSIERLLYSFVGEKLILSEVDELQIQLSDVSLSKLIKNQEIFIKDDNFSRIKYEKFLVNKGISAVYFESNLLRQEKKKQLFDFVSGGIIPSDFLINNTFNEINQKRNIQILDLDEILKDNLKFSKNEIETYFNENKKNYIQDYKTIKFIELNQKNLTESDEFNDIFFKKIDQIEDFIVEGKNLDFIIEEFSLENFSTATFNNEGKDKKLNSNDFLPSIIIKKVFNLKETDTTVFVESKDKYFVVEIIKTENIQKNVEDKSVENEIASILERNTKRKLIVEYIDKVNNKNFKKMDFDKLSKDKNVPIKSIKLNNQSDDKVLKKELINQVYRYPEKSVVIITDIGLEETYLVYIDNIENASINKNDEKYKEYQNLSKGKLISNLYNTYDLYLKNKYKVDINYKALDKINNYFR
jgi:peptidyl-prolyl cis-trans isomerase D